VRRSLSWKLDTTCEQCSGCFTVVEKNCQGYFHLHLSRRPGHSRLSTGPWVCHSSLPRAVTKNVFCGFFFPNKRHLLGCGFITRQLSTQRFPVYMREGESVCVVCSLSLSVTLPTPTHSHTHIHICSEFCSLGGQQKQKDQCVSILANVE
jgi:hypothetical protein